MNKLESGRETIKLLKDIFHIGEVGVRKITLVAEVGCATTINIDTFARLQDVDITPTEISRNDLVDCHTYEVSIKRVIKGVSDE